jgi:hypothetical protein
VEGYGLNNAVPFVEHAQDRGALGHWRDAAFAIGGRRGLLRWRQRRVLAFLALAARGERKGNDQRYSERAHAYSGIQGS